MAFSVLNLHFRNCGHRVHNFQNAKSIRFAADTSECIHCKTDGLFCDICSFLKFIIMLYASDLSRNCVVFAYPNICKRAFSFCELSHGVGRRSFHSLPWRDFDTPSPWETTHKACLMALCNFPNTRRSGGCPPRRFSCRDKPCTMPASCSRPRTAAPCLCGGRCGLPPVPVCRTGHTGDAAADTVC